MQNRYTKRKIYNLVLVWFQDFQNFVLSYDHELNVHGNRLIIKCIHSGIATHVGNWI